ncbi:serine/threonine-protein kinase [Cellulomonas sp. WB94]|uniref:serine/threonine-protein kinase n=1 Tax=Cellulomonas sp. WB94 TaxID=2173174 RepID=UPI001F5B6607|nr:serine/threonine-protein kinase [Cellulomonas sp. WB94]
MGTLNAERLRDWWLGRRYQLLSPIGRGGAGTVFRGMDERLARPVAIKVVDLAGVRPRDIGRFAAEARVLGGLAHPGLVALLDVGADLGPTREPLAYLVMELVEGVTLATMLDRGPLDPGQAADVGQQLAQALDHAHAAGIVHRDVKPANILLSAEPVVSGHIAGPSVTTKLADFGIALGPTAAADETLSDRTRGTASYLSPEQALAQTLGPPSDVYSLGLVLLESLTGVRAYPGGALSSSLARLLATPDVPERLGPRWSSLLRGMTTMVPEARPTASDVAEALRQMRRPALWDRVAARLD